MLNRIAISLVSILLLAACQSTYNPGSKGEDSTIPQYFQTIKLAGLDSVHSDPDADFSVYNAVLLEPLNFDSVVIQQVSSARLPHTKKWELTDDDKARIQETFKALMVEKLTESNGLTLAETAGQNTLRVKVFLTDIAPNAPKDDFESRPSARSRIYSEGFGDVSIRVEFQDSISQKPLLVAQDKRKGDTTWRLNNSVTNWEEVHRMLRSWALQISHSLDDLQAGQ